MQTTLADTVSVATCGLMRSNPETQAQDTTGKNRFFDVSLFFNVILGVSWGFNYSKMAN